MDVELIPTPDVPSHQDASVDATPVPSANRLCVITRPTHRQLSMLLFDFQLYFSLLKTAALGRTVLYSPVMSSTQNVFSGNLSFANLLPQALGTICVAEQQTKGKGKYVVADGITLRSRNHTVLCCGKGITECL